MQIPFKLMSKIESLIDGLSLNDIFLARKELTRLYRDRDFGNFLNPLVSNKERLAYLVVRLPAIYVVVRQVFSEIQRRCGGERIDSLLDIGAGPGTVLLAAREAFPPLKIATLVERDEGFIKLGKELTEEKNWICRDFTKNLLLPAHDLIVASYSLGELCEKERIEVLGKLWKMTKKFFVIIEPGTRTSFESLKKMREVLLLSGACLIAPCPHFEKCPMKENDWCHFSARVERSSLHRKIKGATLNYEDEKFSYLIFSKNNIPPCEMRVVRHPFKGAGFIKIQLCTKNGIEERIVTKKTKLQFSYTRKIKWGDEFCN
jgi:ribosomal protein RSM22 (predicted rRNA methylase)